MKTNKSFWNTAWSSLHRRVAETGTAAAFGPGGGERRDGALVQWRRILGRSEMANERQPGRSVLGTLIAALEKDRARRYETADGLAMDVQRFWTMNRLSPGHRAGFTAFKN